MKNQEFNTTIRKFHPLSDDELEQFVGICTLKKYSKGEHILREGNVLKGIHFVASGIIRKTFVTEQGKEIDHNFFTVGEFAQEMKSLTQQSPTEFNLTALNEVSTIYFSRDRLLDLYNISSSFQALGRKLLEHKLIEQQNHTSMFLTLSPIERYNHILQTKPYLIQDVPLQYLATYLGMARETLSRIRRKKATL